MRANWLLGCAATSLVACGLTALGTGETVDDTLGSATEAGADVAKGSADASMKTDADALPPPPCTTCSATCPSACAGKCPSDSVCFSGASVSCANDCGEDCKGSPQDCSVCDPAGKKIQACGNPLCSVGALTCPCTTSSDCPDDRDVCMRGKCARCGLGGKAGGTAGLSCKCHACDGTKCDGC